MSGLWWIALFQFIVCGLFGGAAFVVPKMIHIPSSERIYYLYIGFAFIIFALIGLLFMSSAGHF